MFNLGTTLFQHNTLGALMEGLFEGTLSMDELLNFGNTGIGTLDDFDGELVILDGIGYQCKTDGSVIKLTGKELVPYAAVTQLHPHRMKTLHTQTNMNEATLKLVLEKHFQSKNLFYAIRIDGAFQNVNVRAVPKQNRPYPRLIDASRNQTLFRAQNIAGTVVGFYTPEIFGNVAAPGFHLHFLSDDRSFGGHLFGFTLTNGSISWEAQDAFIQNFPSSNQDFLEKNINLDVLENEISEAEE